MGWRSASHGWLRSRSASFTDWDSRVASAPRDCLPRISRWRSVSSARGRKVGHFSFVGSALLAFAVLRRWMARLPSWSWRIAPYGIGSCAAFWLVARLAAF